LSAFSDDIRASAKRFRSNFLFAPSTIDTGAIDGIPPSWGAMKRMLACNKINIERQDGADKLFPESIGLWFSPDGAVFAFPKSFWQMPVHRIPGGKTAVSICGEINCIKENDLEGVRIIYNPSKEYGVFTFATRNPGVLEYEWPNPEIVNALADKRVPAIRCDTRKGSGIIHLPEGIGIDFKPGELISELILYPI
jgi:hypothetical protein